MQKYKARLAAFIHIAEAFRATLGAEKALDALIYGARAMHENWEMAGDPATSVPEAAQILFWHLTGESWIEDIDDVVSEWSKAFTSGTGRKPWYPDREKDEFNARHGSSQGA